jgi:hypothetical protein
VVGYYVTPRIDPHVHANNRWRIAAHRWRIAAHRWRIAAHRWRISGASLLIAAHRKSPFSVTSFCKAHLSTYSTHGFGR